MSTLPFCTSKLNMFESKSTGKLKHSEQWDSSYYWGIVYFNLRGNFTKASPFISIFATLQETVGSPLSQVQKVLGNKAPSNHDIPDHHSSDSPNQVVDKRNETLLAPSVQLKLAGAHKSGETIRMSDLYGQGHHEGVRNAGAFLQKADLWYKAQAQDCKSRATIRKRTKLMRGVSNRHGVYMHVFGDHGT